MNVVQFPCLDCKSHLPYQLNFKDWLNLSNLQIKLTDI